MFSFHKQSLFTKNVSQKIRHLRFNAKKKSMTGSSSGVVKKKFKPTMPEVAMTVAGESDESESELETAEHLREIARIWGKQKVTETDMADTKQLLKATVKSRMQLLKDHPDGRLAPVMKKYPCFTDGSMVNIFLSLAVAGLAISLVTGKCLYLPGIVFPGGGKYRPTLLLIDGCTVNKKSLKVNDWCTLCPLNGAINTLFVEMSSTENIF